MNSGSIGGPPLVAVGGFGGGEVGLRITALLVEERDTLG